MLQHPISPAKYTIHTDSDIPLEGIDWNRLPDPIDKDIWDRITANFWLDTKIPLAKDIQTWSEMSDDEQTATMRVFSGLTLLDTIQGTVGAVSLIPDAATQHEEAIYTNFSFMESVHAKSYSSIFMTLATGRQIEDAFAWSRSNQQLQHKSRTILHAYRTGDEPHRKIASVLLESFLFYSGFYLPLRFSSLGKLTSTADIIRLIIRDEAIHGYYIGYKYQQLERTLPEETRHELAEFVVETLLELYENEVEYTRHVYDDLGWSADVQAFLRYNANKAMQNMGYDNLFPVEDTNYSAAVRTSLDPSSNENHDFFSGSGSSYVVGRAEETDDGDWDF